MAKFVNDAQSAKQSGKLDPEQIHLYLSELDPAWSVSESAASITRKFSFKGYARAVYLANLCTWIADQHNHHPDICFGWGYCSVTLTSHDVQGISHRDVRFAARLDALLKESTV